MFCISTISGDDSPPQNRPLPPKEVDFPPASPGLLFTFWVDAGRLHLRRDPGAWWEINAATRVG